MDLLQTIADPPTAVAEQGIGGKKGVPMMAVGAKNEKKQEKPTNPNAMHIKEPKK